MCHRVICGKEQRSLVVCLRLLKRLNFPRLISVLKDGPPRSSYCSSIEAAVVLMTSISTVWGFFVFGSHLPETIVFTNVQSSYVNVQVHQNDTRRCRISTGKCY